MDKNYNVLKPVSPDFLLKTYQGLRLADDKRDDQYSPLHDGIMNAICTNLKEYCDIDTFNKAWTSSMFPERAAKEILRLVEEFNGAKRDDTKTQEKQETIS